MRRSLKIALAAATVTAAALTLVTAPRDAEAATATSQFTVTATVATACTIASANITAAYDPNTVTPTTAPGSVTLHCTRGTGYGVGLSSANAWTMLSGANALNYTILKGATTTQWTNTGAGLVSGSASAFATPIVLAATASIPPGQDVPAGTYVDTVTATVTF
jgi:spore coat protein U-like protein